MADEVKVNISATDNTEAGFQSAEAGTDSLTEYMESGFERVAERLAELFAVEKIKAFVEESIQEFAKVERGMNVLGAQVAANGESWAKNKDGVESYLQSEENLYGFTKEQLLSSLTDAETKTHNLAVAMKVVDEAQKLAAVGIGSLQENTDSLSLAYQGNSRGLMQLGRELGLTRDQAKDAATVFDALGKATSHVGDVLDDTQSKLNSISVTFENLKESTGAELADLVDVFGALAKILASVVEGLFAIAKYFIDLSVGLFRLVLGIGSLKEQWHDFFSSIKSDTKDTADDFVKIWGDANKKVDVMTDQAFAKMAEGNTKAIEDKKKLAEANKAALEQQKKDLEEYVKSNDKLMKEDFERTTALDKKRHDEHMKLLEEEQKKQEEACKATYKAAEGLANSLVELEKTKGKEGAEIAKDFAVIKAIISTAEGVANALSDYPYPSSLVVGGLVAAEGAVEIGKIEGALDTGGIVTQPTLSWVGEKRPEAVIPLEELPKYTGGGQGGGITIKEVHVHDVQTPGQFANRLPAAIQRANARQGYRLAT